MHANQFQWVWLLWFRSYGSFLFPFKMAKIFLWTMDYSPWSSENLNYWNQLKKFMQVGIDVKCMQTNFGGCGFIGFGDIATFKNGQISLSDHGLQSMVIKKFNLSEQAQKIYANKD